MEVNPKYCNVPECGESFVPHYWGSIKAHSNGWMIQKDGTAWCPKHLPYWVARWRQKTARLRRNDDEVTDEQ